MLIFGSHAICFYDTHCAHCLSEPKTRVTLLYLNRPVRDAKPRIRELEIGIVPLSKWTLEPNKDWMTLVIKIRGYKLFLLIVMHNRNGRESITLYQTRVSGWQDSKTMHARFEMDGSCYCALNACIMGSNPLSICIYRS